MKHGRSRGHTCLIERAGTTYRVNLFHQCDENYALSDGDRAP